MGNLVQAQILLWFEGRQSRQLFWSLIIKTATREDSFAWEDAFASIKSLTSLQQLCTDVNRATSTFTTLSPGQGLLVP